MSGGGGGVKSRKGGHANFRVTGRGVTFNLGFPAEGSCLNALIMHGGAHQHGGLNVAPHL